jgi:hypothetical protein
MTSIVKVTQNFTDLHLATNVDENRSNHRSKTGNKSAFKFIASQVDVDALCDVNLDRIECFDEDDGLLVSPRINIVNVHHLPIQPNSSIAISPVSPLTTSKSENNIFDKNISLNAESPSHFNVVSLSDLSDDTQYYNSAEKSEHHYMNDLSKTLVLNRLSDDDITGKILNRF